MISLAPPFAGDPLPTNFLNAQPLQKSAIQRRSNHSPFSWVISAVLDEKIEAYVHPDIISPMVYCQPKPFDNPGIVEQETEKGYVVVCCI